jgi:monofunctional chorismate mutase
MHLEEAMKLEYCREKIDQIDTQILALLNRRAEIAKEIGTVKSAAGLPIIDEAREEAVLSTIERDNPGDLSDDAAVRIFRQILDESRRVQVEHVGSVTATGEPVL